MDLNTLSIFKDIIITKSNNNVIVNGKIFLLSDILFISFREADDYKYVKLEAKRKYLLIANEKLLYNECKSYDEALQFCRIIRDFIDPSILINYKSMGWGNTDDGVFSNLTGTESHKDSRLENWHYLE